MFWEQTPRSFVAIMEGAARAAKHRFDVAIVQAWHTEAFARTKSLKKLDHYLSDKPRKAQTPEEMIAVLRSIKEGGAPMNIRKVN